MSPAPNGATSGAHVDGRKASGLDALLQEDLELFFKALKQNLKVKTFVGTTENALRIQIWTALLALMLLKWLHYLSRASWSLSNLAHLLPEFGRKLVCDIEPRDVAKYQRKRVDS